MKNKHLFIIATVCALCTFRAQDARAQKMYMDGEILILDCGSDSGFPQNIVEKQTGQKATIQDDINLIHGTQNKTVYQKLEIETSNNSKVTWTAAYNACAVVGICEDCRGSGKNQLMGDAAIGRVGYCCISSSRPATVLHTRCCHNKADCCDAQCLYGFFFPNHIFMLPR